MTEPDPTGGYPTIEEIATRISEDENAPEGGCSSFQVFAFADGSLTYNAAIFGATERQGSYVPPEP